MFEGLSEILTINFAIAKPATVVLGRLLKSALIRKVEAFAATAVLAAFLVSLIRAGIQRGLTKLEGATKVAVAVVILAATTIAPAPLVFIAIPPLLFVVPIIAIPIIAPVLGLR
jgi:hypothetical protein